MIDLVIAAALAASGADLNANTQRQAFTGCLREAVQKAKESKVQSDGFDAFARGACSDPEAKFQSALVAIDVKSGIGRSAAAKAAKAQIDDYYVGAVDRYALELEMATPK